MKPVGLISAGVLLLLLGAVPPMYAQEEKHEQEAKPQKQEQAKPEKQQQQAKPARQEEKQAKSESSSRPNHQRNRSRPRRSRTRNRVSSTSKHKGSGPTVVRRIVAATSTTKVGLAVIIMPALRQMAGATTTDAGSTLTADTGSMLDPIRRGSTGKTFTSLWEPMGYGMQSHTITLL